MVAEILAVQHSDHVPLVLHCFQRRQGVQQEQQENTARMQLLELTAIADQTIHHQPGITWRCGSGVSNRVVSQYSRIRSAS